LPGSPVRTRVAAVVMAAACDRLVERGVRLAAGLLAAALEALAELRVGHVEMPATPERVWRAIRAGATVAVLSRPLR